jgi:hypothetical protein
MAMVFGEPPEGPRRIPEGLSEIIIIIIIIIKNIKNIIIIYLFIII